MRRPRVQLRLRNLLVLVACSSLALWVWVEYFSPAHLWHRTIRADDASPERWEAALQGLAGKASGVSRQEAISALCLALYDPSTRVRETAARALKGAGTEARPAVPHLVKALKDESFTVRLGAAESLGYIVDPTDETCRIAVPALAEALEDSYTDVRIAAGFSLALIGRGVLARDVMTAALREGRDRNAPVRLALGLAGDTDQAAVDALRTAARRSYDARIRQLSKDALDRISNPVPSPNP